MRLIEISTENLVSLFQNVVEVCIEAAQLTFFFVFSSLD